MNKLQQEIRALSELYPSLSPEEILQELRTRGWQFEIPSWFQLLSHSAAKKGVLQDIASTQLIPTGQYCTLDNVVDANTILRLRETCDHQFSMPGRPPVSIPDLEESDRSFMQRLAKRIARQALAACDVNNESINQGDYTLLMSRCLLRRTYSPDIWLEEYRNKNNQHWHQDSNPLFGSRPMLTIWIALQEGAGSLKPGLELSTLPALEFSTSYGDCAERIEDVATAYGIHNYQQTVADVPIGCAIVFNGMTFHRTFVSEEMTGHRDALLIRLCKSADCKFFPGDRNSDLVI